MSGWMKLGAYAEGPSVSARVVVSLCWPCFVWPLLLVLTGRQVLTVDLCSTPFHTDPGSWGRQLLGGSFMVKMVNASPVTFPFRRDACCIRPLEMH